MGWERQEDGQYTCELRGLYPKFRTYVITYGFMSVKDNFPDSPVTLVVGNSGRGK